MIIKKDMSLLDLVKYNKELQAKEADGEVVPDEVSEMAYVAEHLLAGKVDLAAQFLKGIEAHIEGCELQLKELKDKHDLAKELMKKAVIDSGGTRLDGQSFSIGLYNNSVPSTIIEDPSAIPLQFHKVTYTTTFKYSDTDFLYWTRVALGRMVEWKKDLVEAEKNASPFYRLDIADNERDRLQKLFCMDVSKSEIANALKAEPGSVRGVRIEKGQHIRIGKAKTKPAAITDKVALNG